MEDLKQQYFDELQRLSNLEYRDESKIAELKENFNAMSIEIRKKEKLLQEAQWAYLSTHPSKRLLSFCFDDDDEDYTSAITLDEPILSTEEPDNSLSMGDEHLDTIPVMESDEFIKSGVKNLIPIPSESEGIPKHMCDVPSHDNSPPLDVSKDQIEDFSESNKEFSSIDDDSFSIDDIDYVEASPPDPELVSSEVIEIVIPEVGGIDDDILLMIESDEVIKSSVEDLVPIPSESEDIPEQMCDVPFYDNSPPLDVLNDQIEDFSESNNEVSSIDDDSFSIYKIDYVEASPPDFELVSSEVMEIVIPEVGGIDDDIPLTIKDDNLREKLSNVHLLIANIKALKDNPTPSSESLTKSSSTSLNSFLEKTNTFHNSFPEFENFYFDLGKISSGSTTTHSDISLPDYEAFSFDDDHIQEISSGSTTTHSDISLPEYDSFIFDLTHEEFVDELAHIISPSEYDCFYFCNLPDQGELMFVLNSGIRENLSTTLVNLPIEDDYSPLLAYVVWIFLAYLTYLVIPPYLHPFENEDTIFDLGITINHVYSIPENLKTLAKGFYPPSLYFLSF
nr:hypothetical protein [Tanacetum cinerariifolium]